MAGRGERAPRPGEDHPFGQKLNEVARGWSRSFVRLQSPDENVRNAERAALKAEIAQLNEQVQGL